MGKDVTNAIKSITAKVPEQVKAQGPNAENLYRKGIAYGLNDEELDKLTETEGYKKALETRDLWDKLVEKYGGEDKVPAEFINVILRNEDGIFNSEGQKLLKACASSGVTAQSDPCGQLSGMLKGQALSSEIITSAVVASYDAVLKAGNELAYLQTNGGSAEEIAEAAGRLTELKQKLQVALKCQANWTSAAAAKQNVNGEATQKEDINGVRQTEAYVKELYGEEHDWKAIVNASGIPADDIYKQYHQNVSHSGIYGMQANPNMYFGGLSDIEGANDSGFTVNGIAFEGAKTGFIDSGKGLILLPKAYVDHANSLSSLGVLNPLASSDFIVSGIIGGVKEANEPRLYEYALGTGEVSTAKDLYNYNQGYIGGSLGFELATAGAGKGILSQGQKLLGLSDNAVSGGIRLSSDHPLKNTAIVREGTDARPVLNQGNTPTCGPTSCKMVLDTQGNPVDLDKLVEASNVNKNGMLINRLPNILDEFGVDATFKAGQSIADIANYTKNGNPIIVRIKYPQPGNPTAGHAVVVDGITKRNGIDVVAIRDPHGQQYFSPVSEFEKHFSGQVIRIGD